MHAPDSLLTMVSNPVEVLMVHISIEVGAICNTAGILVGVRPDLARVVLQIELGDAGVGAVLKIGNDLGLGDTGHVVLLVESRIEQPHTTQQSLCRILRGTSGQVVVPRVSVFRRDEVDGLGEILGDGCIDLVDRCLGHILHLGGKRQREGFITLCKFPEPEASHEVSLTQIPVLVISREEVVIHGGDGFQGIVATEQSVVVALPG